MWASSPVEAGNQPLKPRYPREKEVSWSSEGLGYMLQTAWRAAPLGVWLYRESRGKPQCVSEHVCAFVNCKDDRRGSGLILECSAQRSNQLADWQIGNTRLPIAQLTGFAVTNIRYCDDVGWLCSGGVCVFRNIGQSRLFLMAWQPNFNENKLHRKSSLPGGTTIIVQQKFLPPGSLS